MRNRRIRCLPRMWMNPTYSPWKQLLKILKKKLKLQAKVKDEDKQKILYKHDEFISRLDENETAEKKEHQQKELKKFYNSIITKLYQSAGNVPEEYVDIFLIKEYVSECLCKWSSWPYIEKVDWLNPNEDVVYLTHQNTEGLKFVANYMEIF